jgi:hypothetical protein
MNANSVLAIVYLVLSWLYSNGWNILTVLMVLSLAATLGSIDKKTDEIKEIAKELAQLRSEVESLRPSNPKFAYMNDYDD